MDSPTGNKASVWCKQGKGLICLHDPNRHEMKSNFSINIYLSSIHLMFFSEWFLVLGYIGPTSKLQYEYNGPNITVE